MYAVAAPQLHHGCCQSRLAGIHGDAGLCVCAAPDQPPQVQPLGGWLAAHQGGIPEKTGCYAWTPARAGAHHGWPEHLHTCAPPQCRKLAPLHKYWHSIKHPQLCPPLSSNAVRAAAAQWHYQAVPPGHLPWWVSPCVCPVGGELCHCFLHCCPLGHMCDCRRYLANAEWPLPADAEPDSLCSSGYIIFCISRPVRPTGNWALKHAGRCTPAPYNPCHACRRPPAIATPSQKWLPLMACSSWPVRRWDSAKPHACTNPTRTFSTASLGSMTPAG